MLDQALLSGTGFLVAGAFVASSSKQEFAIYSLSWASVQLTTSIQNATILTPLTANFRMFHGPERSRFVSSLSRLGQHLSILIGAIGLLTCAGVTILQGGVDWSLAGAIGIALIGTWARELRRTRQFVELRPTSALRGDFAYAVVLLLLLVFGSTARAPLTAAWALLAWGVAGLVTGGLWEGRRALGSDDVARWTRTRALLADQVRWTLPSVGVSWLQANAYNFVTAATTGMHSVADINSARIFAAPIAMGHAGWNRLFLPATSLAISLGERRRAIRLGAISVAILSGGCLVYGALLAVASAFVRRIGTAISVEHIEVLIGLWIVYMLIVGARGVGTSILVAETSFAPLFGYGVAAATATLGGMILLGEQLGSRGVLAAMVCGEIMLGSLIWSRILSRRQVTSANLPSRAD